MYHVCTWYVLVHTSFFASLSPALQNFEKCCVMQTCWCQMPTKYVLFVLSKYFVHTCMYYVTKILQGIQFYIVCLWEMILCVMARVRDMYAVVLQH